MMNTAQHTVHTACHLETQVYKDLCFIAFECFRYLEVDTSVQLIREMGDYSIQMCDEISVLLTGTATSTLAGSCYTKQLTQSSYILKVGIGSSKLVSYNPGVLFHLKRLLAMGPICGPWVLCL